MMMTQKCSDSNVQKVVDAHLSRAEHGLVKYGVDTTRKDLTDLEWLRHLQEELMDGAIYAQRLIEETALPAHSATITAFLQDKKEWMNGKTTEEILREFVDFVIARK